MEDGVEFHILRFFSVCIVSDLYDELKPTSEYRPPQRAPEIPRDVKTFGGIPLPRYYSFALVHGIPEEMELKYFNSSITRKFFQYFSKCFIQDFLTFASGVFFYFISYEKYLRNYSETFTVSVCCHHIT